MSLFGLKSGAKILTSQWGGLNDFLLAKFYPVKRLNGGWEQSRDKKEVADHFIVDDEVEVHAPITDASSELTANWQSPFEASGPEGAAPKLSAMLQSGSLAEGLSQLGSAAGSDSSIGKYIQKGAERAANFLRDVEGRAGITKLNSTQIYTGSPPMKLSMTLHFRAFQDPASEVEAPIKQLKEWAVPQFLAAESLIIGAAKNGTQQSLSSTVFPSKVPQLIGLRYGRNTFLPFVIEAISDPMSTPLTSEGFQQACSVQVILSSLTALDRRDIRAIYR